MYNQEIRAAARESHVRLWQIAERLGCNDSNFSRKLRKEFSPEEKTRVLGIIEEIAKEASKNAKAARTAG